jgi:hypothetical protein
MQSKTKQVGTKKKKETICVHVPVGYKAKLNKLAFDQDRSVSALIRRQIDKMLKEGQNDE